jgi:hypothetical protein
MTETSEPTTTDAEQAEDKKVEKQRREREGKTFSQKGTEVRK